MYGNQVEFIKMHSAMLALTFTIFFLLMESTSSEEMDRYMRQYARNLVTVQCKDNYSNNSMPVLVQPRIQKLQLSDLLNGSVKIDFDEITQNNVLLTFSNGQSSNQYDHVDCFTTKNVESVVITNLTDDIPYTFCLMDHLAKTVSPLDCLSFRSGTTFDDDNIWLREDDKPLAIGLLVMGILLSLGLGVSIGVVIVRRSTDNDYSDQSMSSRTDFRSHEWKQDNGIRDFSYDDTLSIASDKYVAAVNPSRFDVIKMKLEKAGNSGQGNENQYDLEDMPYSKAPSVPEYRDSGISGTSGPIYAISSKAMAPNESENNEENFYLCVEQVNVGIGQNNEKLE